MRGLGRCLKVLRCAKTWRKYLLRQAIVTFTLYCACCGRRSRSGLEALVGSISVEARRHALQTNAQRAYTLDCAEIFALPTWTSVTILTAKFLHDITLYAKPGQKVALVGATGAGKTTITNLVNRFYDIRSGQILYDGIDISAH